MEWIASFAHPLVTKQILRRLGANLVRRSLPTQLTQGHTGTQTLKKSRASFLDVLQECGWDTRLIHETDHRMDLTVSTCPFGSQASENQNFCILHSAMCGEAALAEFGYAKVNLQRGTGTPPTNCSIQIYTVPSKENLAAEGLEYKADQSPHLLPTGLTMPDLAIANISPREEEVLALVGKGLSNKEIASTLNLSVRTAENHIARIQDKLNIHGRAKLIRFAIMNHIM